MNGVTLEEIERLELEERRAKTAPMRLSAWAISFTTALIAAPLAIPLIVHNLVRGEDVRSGALALGVAGLFAVLAQSGMAPNLPELL
jgi:acetyl-CoA carboxylase alpha subunit